MKILTTTSRALLVCAVGFAVIACSQAGGETNPPADNAVETAETVSDPVETEAGTPAPALYDLTARFVDKGIEYGNPDAAVTLVEYASVTCPACAGFHVGVMPTIKENYVKTGKVKFIFREFPTPPVQVALAGFVTARCAGEANHMAVLDDFFGTQADILNATRAGQAESALKQLAARHSVNEASFDGCLADLDIRRAIAASIEAGETDGVNATPTLFLNGEKLGSAEARTAEGLSAFIDAALNAPETSDETTIAAPEGEQ